MQTQLKESQSQAGFRSEMRQESRDSVRHRTLAQSHDGPPARATPTARILWTSGLVLPTQSLPPPLPLLLIRPAYRVVSRHVPSPFRRVEGK